MDTVDIDKNFTFRFCSTIVSTAWALFSERHQIVMLASRRLFIWFWPSVVKFWACVQHRCFIGRPWLYAGLCCWISNCSTKQLWNVDTPSNNQLIDMQLIVSGPNTHPFSLTFLTHTPSHSLPSHPLHSPHTHTLILTPSILTSLHSPSTTCLLCLHMYTHTHTHTYSTHSHVHNTHTRTHTHTHTHTHAYTHTHTHVCTHSIHTCTHNTCIHTHTYTQHTHAHTHTCTHRNVCNSCREGVCHQRGLHEGSQEGVWQQEAGGQDGLQEHMNIPTVAMAVIIIAYDLLP